MSPEVAAALPADELDMFVRNAHHVRVLRGRRWGSWDEDQASLGTRPVSSSGPAQILIGSRRLKLHHSTLRRARPQPTSRCLRSPRCSCRTRVRTHPTRAWRRRSLRSLADASTVTADALTKEVQALVGAAAVLPSEVEDAVGEMCVRPSSAAFLLADTRLQRARADGGPAEHGGVPRRARRAGGDQAHHAPVCPRRGRVRRGPRRVVDGHGRHVKVVRGWCGVDAVLRCNL